MAFEIDLGTPHQIQRMEDGSASSEIEIGFDPDHDVFYRLTVTLDVGVGVAGHELRYWITETHPNGVQTDMFSGLETRAIGKTEREAIFDVVLREASRLVSISRPENVTIFTSASDLPPKAVVKYERIGAHFTKLGYQVRELEPQTGIRGWHFAFPTLSSY